MSLNSPVWAGWQHVDRGCRPVRDDWRGAGVLERMARSMSLPHRKVTQERALLLAPGPDPDQDG
jgi:hypothetical protein